MWLFDGCIHAYPRSLTASYYPRSALVETIIAGARPLCLRLPEAIWHAKQRDKGGQFSRSADETQVSITEIVRHQMTAQRSG